MVLPEPRQPATRRHDQHRYFMVTANVETYKYFTELGIKIQCSIDTFNICYKG
jgi:hypothetical protein